MVDLNPYVALLEQYRLRHREYLAKNSSPIEMTLEEYDRYCARVLAQHQEIQLFPPDPVPDADKTT